MRVFSAACALMLLVGASFTPTVFADHSININTADSAALVTLTGIGEVKAQAIIDYRATNGPFKAKEDIQDVSGIGPATYNNIKDHITVGTSDGATPDASTPTSESSGSAPSSSSSGSSAAAPSSGAFVIEAGNDRVAIVGADMQLIASAYRDKKPEESAKFSWNFGDGSTSRGASVFHRFEYPGRYVVVVAGSSGEDSASDRFIVTAEEAKLAAWFLPDGGVEIENLAAREVDLSHWIVKSESFQFVLPDNSHVLGGQSMHIAPATLGFRVGSSAALAFPSGEVVVDARARVFGVEVSESAERTTNANVTERRVEYESPQEIIYEKPREYDDAAEETFVATSSQMAAAASASGSWKWWFAAFGLAGLAAGGVVLSRRFGRGEWDIVEERPEAE